MKEQILDLLNSSKAYTVKEITNALGIENENITRKLLAEMCDNLELHQTKKNKYILFEKSPLKKGTILIAKGGYGFVNYGGKKDAFIHSSNLNSAMDGDTVAIEIINITKEKSEAKVVKVVPKKAMSLVGEIVVKRKKTYIKLDNNKNNLTVVLDARNSLVDGTKVVINLKDKIDNDTYTAEIVEVLGHKDDPGVDLLSILRAHNIVKEFPEEVLEEVKNVPSELTQEIIDSMKAKGAIDLRNEQIFTIDGDDTKDIDDAASIKILPNGNYELSIHIANVSEYVKPNTALWDEAVNKRGTSVYIPGASVPMLPRELSNGICSLNPDVDRLALTFKMEFDPKGNIVNFNVFESIIQSKKQMTYKNVNKILEADIIPEGYEPYVDDLKLMQKLAHILRKKRIRSGFLDFDINENKVILDEKGKAIDVILRSRGEGEKLIEDFMIETGEQMSMYLDEHEKENSHVYRIHGIPDEERIISLNQLLTVLNYSKSKLKDISQRSFQTLLDDISDKKEYLVIAREALRSMQKAVYSPNNIGHYALGASSDCQVTSPIRRAGDLVNHVLIKENIYNKKSGINWNSELPSICCIASNTERNADLCEKDAVKLKSAEYMESHIGEEFEGIITGFTRTGLFVELPNLVEGFVNTNSLTDDNYVYDKEKFCFIGRTTHRKYRLGDKVNIKVVSASKSAQTIDFEITSGNNSKVKKINKFDITRK